MVIAKLDALQLSQDIAKSRAWQLSPFHPKPPTVRPTVSHTHYSTDVCKLLLRRHQAWSNIAILYVQIYNYYFVSLHNITMRPAPSHRPS
jgi:hypothetical protein